MGKHLVLFLGLICGVFFSNEKALAMDMDNDYSWVYGGSSAPFAFSHGEVDVKAQIAAIQVFEKEKKKPLSKTPAARRADIDLASQVVSMACANFEQDFFGFAPNDPKTTEYFQLLRMAGQELNLFNSWIDQPNRAIQLTGYLESFGNTLGLANQRVVEDKMVEGRVIVRRNLLGKAYNDMGRLISGQVVQLDKNRTAKKKEANVLLQAAASLGQQFAIETLVVDIDIESMVKSLVNHFYEYYDLGKNKERTALLHNTILLKHSVGAALIQKEKKVAALFIDSFLRAKGLDQRILDSANSYLSSITLPGPHPYLESIITDTQTKYDSRPASKILRGIEVLSLDPEMVYEKFKPYKDKGALTILRNPDSFIRKLKKEFKERSVGGDSRDWVERTLDSIGLVLKDPKNIRNMSGFKLGSIAESKKAHQLQRTKEIELTWLDAAHDFVTIYFYAVANDLLAKFYNDPTPGDNGPCLPGKIRCFQTWYEIESGLTSGADTILEKVFADTGGIEIPNAINMLYDQYLEGEAILYCMEALLSYSDVPPKQQAQKAVQLALGQEFFQQQFFNESNLEEGIMTMVIDQLPRVVDKFRKNKKLFPIQAFHGSKYQYIQLEDDPTGNLDLRQKIRAQVKLQVRTMMDRTQRSMALGK